MTTVLDEDATLDIALSGRSIARVGEGELKMAVQHWNLKSQAYDPKLGAETLDLLHNPSPALACLPKFRPAMPNPTFWAKFERPPYTGHYRLPEYGSAFISRPDVAPNIDRPDYWARVRTLWAGRDVVLAGPGLKVLKMPDAASVRLVTVPYTQAYAEIDRIEEEIGKPAGPVFLVIGATATVLAARLARKGVWALDMGHLGHFMGAAGSYSLDRSTLISAAYLEQNRKLHARGDYGKSGHRRCADVLAYLGELQAFGMLDYGSGQGTLKTTLVEAGFTGPIEEYDPAIKATNAMPKPADLVTCTDVLEHCEEDKLPAVLDHIRKLAKKAVYLVISTRPATKTLDDGRNAHICLHDEGWWLETLTGAGFTIDRHETGKDDLKVWCK